ncbi:MAG TPA: methyltransferase domain-containing protein [Actinobacteria bacterium]|nr:methyltransferase domain-containing protein [Actinomycetota bacterium]
MKKTKNYHAYTQYDKEPSGLKRLNFIAREVKKFAEKSELKSLKILDVGCGNGNISIPLASLGYEITGIDIDLKSVEHAKQNNPFKNAQFIVGDVEKDVPENNFDIIICSEILEHLNSPSEMLKYLKSKLNPAGLLLVTVPNGYGPFGLVDLLVRVLRKVGFAKAIDFLRGSVHETYEHIQSSDSATYHTQNFTMGRMRKLLDESNFKINRAVNSNFLFGVPPLYFPFGRGSATFNFLDELDCKVADFLPHLLASGWYFACSIGEQKR